MSTALSQSEGRNDTERSTRLPTKQAVPWPPDTTVHSLLQRVRDEHILCMAEADASKMAELWKAGFRRINIVAQSLGAGIGLSLGWATLNLYMSHDVPFWISSKGHLLPAGYAYWYCIALLYALITIYVARCIAFYVFLSEAVGDSTIQMLPLHPDKCGGLRPVGQLGLRNQY